LKFPFIDLERLERPHRSGVLAVIIAYSLICGYYEIQPRYDHKTPGKFSVACLLMPWDCPDHPDCEPPPPPPPAMKIVFNPNGKEIKSEHCTFHYDVWFDDETLPHEGNIFHGYHETNCSILTARDVRGWTEREGLWQFVEKGSNAAFLDERHVVKGHRYGADMIVLGPGEGAYRLHFSISPTPAVKVPVDSGPLVMIQHTD
jgi:hypothetical protein